MLVMSKFVIAIQYAYMFDLANLRRCVIALHNRETPSDRHKYEIAAKRSVSLVA